MDMKITDVVNAQHDHYRSGEISIQLPDYDADIRMTFPNGSSFVVQFRVEGPSIDICFDAAMKVCNWTGDSMEAAPAFSNQEHIRTEVNQLMIPLSLATLHKDLKSYLWSLVERGEFDSVRDKEGVDVYTIRVQKEDANIFPELNVDDLIDVWKADEIEFITYQRCR